MRQPCYVAIRGDDKRATSIFPGKPGSSMPWYREKTHFHRRVKLPWRYESGVACGLSGSQLGRAKADHSSIELCLRMDSHEWCRCAVDRMNFKVRSETLSMR